VRYMVRNLRCTVTIDSVLANSKTQNAFLFTVHASFRHDYPLAVEPASTSSPLVQKNFYSLPIDMLLSALSFLVVEQSSSEIPEGLMNNPVFCAFPLFTIHKVRQLFEIRNDCFLPHPFHIIIHKIVLHLKNTKLMILTKCQ